jgi:sugar lactone lactonase YvrE
VLALNYTPTPGTHINEYGIDGRPTNVAFGRGEDAKTLYITYGGSMARIKVEKEGYQLP